MGAGLVRVINAPSSTGSNEVKYLQISNPKGVIFCCQKGDFIVLDGQENIFRCLPHVFNAEYEFVSEKDEPTQERRQRGQSGSKE
jgi:hypothetical protein